MLLLRYDLLFRIFYILWPLLCQRNLRIARWQIFEVNDLPLLFCYFHFLVVSQYCFFPTDGSSWQGCQRLGLSSWNRQKLKLFGCFNLASHYFLHLLIRRPSPYISVRSLMMRPSSSKITLEEATWISPRKMGRRWRWSSGGRATYFSGLFSASVTDGDAPDTQDLVGFGENWVPRIERGDSIPESTLWGWAVWGPCLPDGRRPPLGMITLACWPVDGPPSCCCCCPGCFIEGLALLLCCCCCCCWLAWWKSLVSWVWKAPVDSEISGLSWKFRVVSVGKWVLVPKSGEVELGAAWDSSFQDVESGLLVEPSPPCWHPLLCWLKILASWTAMLFAYAASVSALWKAFSSMSPAIRPAASVEFMLAEVSRALLNRLNQLLRRSFVFWDSFQEPTAFSEANSSNFPA